MAKQKSKLRRKLAFLFGRKRKSSPDTNTQRVSGSGVNQAGRDVIQNIGLLSQEVDLFSVFETIDSRIKRAIGNPISPTADGKEVMFSAGKLFSSLVNIGIGPEHAYQLILVIDDFISEELKLSTRSFSTTHIRQAISNAILHSDRIKLGRHERRNLANKYARNYGNPSHATMIVFPNGDTVPLNYEFIEKTFIPDLAESVSGYRGPMSGSRSGEGVFARANIDHMSKEILLSVRRMGIYQVRYNTLCAIAEDLSLQLPHPWFVNKASQTTTIRHDIERAEAHFQDLKPSQQTDLQFWRTAYECFNHISSGILACYESVIGGGRDAAPNTLRNFTRLAADGERQNLALWNFCAISELESHLSECEFPIDEFHFELKATQKAMQRMREADKLKTMRNIERFRAAFFHIVKRRGLEEHMPE